MYVSKQRGGIGSSLEGNHSYDIALPKELVLCLMKSSRRNVLKKIRIGYVLKSADVGTLFSRRNSEN